MNLATGHRLFQVTSKQRAANFQAFLQQIRRRYRGWHVERLLDNHLVHTAATTTAHAQRLGIESLWLPKRSPELNPMDTYGEKVRPPFAPIRNIHRSTNRQSCLSITCNDYAMTPHCSRLADCLIAFACDRQRQRKSLSTCLDYVNKQQIHHLLLELDKRYTWQEQFPPHSPYGEQLERVERVRLKLEKRLGIPIIHSPETAQDSYCFTEIVYAEKNNILLNAFFSSFGNLASGWASLIDKHTAEQVIELSRDAIEEEGFIYIDSAWLLNSPYDGHRPTPWSDDNTWWDRFFGYT